MPKLNNDDLQFALQKYKVRHLIYKNKATHECGKIMSVGNYYKVVESNWHCAPQKLDNLYC